MTNLLCHLIFYMYHHHIYDNDIDVKYFVIRAVYANECQENNIDISSTYSNWFIWIVIILW